MEDKLEEAAALIASTKHLVIFTGAGISTESGLPDYRGPEGIWTLKEKGLKPKLPKIPWHMVEPAQSHLSVVDLQNIGLLTFLISQNVDNLHLKSGIKPEMIAELHGNTTLLKCLGCDLRISKEETGWDDRVHGKGYRTQEELREQPRCPDCGKRLISSVVNFGDPMPQKEMNVSTWHTERSDVFLVLGSSLAVTPAADFPIIAKKNGAKLIIINMGETMLDGLADVRIEGKAGEVMTEIVKRVKQKLSE
jgi:mono-ADP-ribosyltransferase sirtuin 6